MPEKHGILTMMILDITYNIKVFFSDNVYEDDIAVLLSFFSCGGEIVA
jgi:hypothetical protein